jgi:hypothetical protein
LGGVAKRGGGGFSLDALTDRGMLSNGRIEDDGNGGDGEQIRIHGATLWWMKSDRNWRNVCSSTTMSSWCCAFLLASIEARDWAWWSLSMGTSAVVTFFMGVLVAADRMR